MTSRLTRAQHYRQLAEQFRSAASKEPEGAKRQDLNGLAEQYEKLAAKFIPPN